MSPHWHWGSTEEGQIEFESLTTETIDGALDVMRESFFIKESMCVGVDLLSEPGAPEELLDLCMEIARDGVSVVAIDINTKKVVGVAFIKIQVSIVSLRHVITEEELCVVKKILTQSLYDQCDSLQTNTAGKSYFERFSDCCKYKASKSVVDFMVNVDGRLDLFKNYNADCILEVVFLSVLPEYGQRRIGELLVSTALQIGTELKQDNDVRVPVMIRGNNEVTNANMVPSLVSAIVTSKYSQNIATKLGFRELMRISLEEFELVEKTSCEGTSLKHKYCTLVVKVLKPMKTIV